MKGVGFRAYIVSSYFLISLGIVLAEVPTHFVRWALALIASLLALPMGPLAITRPNGFFFILFLGFHGPFTLLLPLVVLVGLLAIILAMLAHWDFYFFPWAFVAHLLYFYLLLCSWAC